MEIYITDIEYVIETEEVETYISALNPATAAKKLKVSTEKYQDMTEEEIHDYISQKIKNNKLIAQEILELPTKVVLPEPENPCWSDPAVTDWLINETGYIVTSWKYEHEKCENCQYKETKGDKNVCNYPKSKYMNQIVHPNNICQYFELK